jgi:Flp pilus assembly protein TadD
VGPSAFEVLMGLVARLLPTDEHVRALLDDGMRQLAMKRYPEAVERFSEVLDHDPDFAEAYNQRGIAFFMQGQASRARAALLTAQSLSLTTALAVFVGQASTKNP